MSGVAATGAAEAFGGQHALVVEISAAHNDALEYVRVIELARARRGGPARVRDSHDGHLYLSLSPIDNACADVDVRSALTMLAQACAGNLTAALQRLSKLEPLAPIRKSRQERSELSATLADLILRASRLSDVGNNSLMLLGFQAMELAHHLETATNLAVEIVGVLFEGERLQEAEDARPRYTQWAQRLAGLATRILPASFRDRYEEEFRAELWELAWIGATKLRQVQHAVSLLNRAFELRSELIRRDVR